MSAQRCHNYLVAKYGPVVHGISLSDPIRIDFADGVDAQVKAQIETEVAAFDFSQPDPDPDRFIDSIAAQANTGLLLIAMRLARASDDATRKKRYAEHVALPSPQRQLLEQAAAQAGIPLV